MRIQALHISSKTRAWFEVEVTGTNTIRIKTPDDKEYYLIKELVLDALGIDEVVLDKILKLSQSHTVINDCRSVYRHTNCVFEYCPNPDLCRNSKDGCINLIKGKNHGENQTQVE